MAEIGAGRGAESATKKRKLKISKCSTAGRKKGTASETKLIRAHDRVREFRGQPLSVTPERHLHCTVCVKNISQKRSTIKTHLSSKSHLYNVEKQQRRGTKLKQHLVVQAQAVIRSKEERGFLVSTLLSPTGENIHFFLCFCV